MILQLLILGVIIIVSPLVPPALVPLSYSLTAALLVQGVDPWILSLVSVGAAVISTGMIWFMQNYIIERLTINADNKGTGFFSRIIYKINTYFRNQQKIAKVSWKRENYIKTTEGRLATFMFAIFCYLPVLPDIIGTRILYKKIKFPYFIIAVIIGKSVTHIPFIFAGKGILQLLGILN